MNVELDLSLSPDLSGFVPPVETTEARLRQLRPMVIGNRIPDGELLELADRLGESEVLPSFNWRLEMVAARVLMLSLPEGLLQERFAASLNQAQRPGGGGQVLITGQTLTQAERVWLLTDPLTVNLELVTSVYVGYWEPGLSRGGVRARMLARRWSLS